MKLALAFVMLAVGCADDRSAPLSVEESALVGCWNGYSGDEHVEYRFNDDRSVVLRNVGRETSYNGNYAVHGTALTLDFGEAPPTYQITITPTELTLLEVGFVYTRTECP